MKTLQRSLCLLMLSAAGSLAIAVPAYAAVVTGESSSAISASGVSSCLHIRQLGVKKVGVDLGMPAFTVRQYIGYCRDAKGTAWMNFASVYVWQQYPVRGFPYKTIVGIDVGPEFLPPGDVNSDSRQRLMHSAPVRTIARCTSGLGKIFCTDGSASPQALSSRVC